MVTAPHHAAPLQLPATDLHAVLDSVKEFQAEAAQPVVLVTEHMVVVYDAKAIDNDPSAVTSITYDFKGWQFDQPGRFADRTAPRAWLIGLGTDRPPEHRLRRCRRWETMRAMPRPWAARTASAARSRAGSPLVIGLRAIVPVLRSVIVFSLFINLLMFVSPLYMLQIYDRVLSSRSESTLIGITVLAVLLLMVYALLEALRTQILVRAGLLFDQTVAGPVFDAIHRGTLRNRVAASCNACATPIRCGNS